MIDVTLTNATIQIAGDEKELKLINKYETYDDNSACFSRGGYDARKLKKVQMMKMVKGRLVGFSGLAKEIIIFCRDNNIKIRKFEDKREHFDFQKKEWEHDELRKLFPKEFDYVEHQIRALQAMVKTNSGLIVASTSAGKSKIISAYIRLTKLPTLILVNKATLGLQLQQDLIKDGVDCGMCYGKGVKSGECMVSTIQSIKKLGDYGRYKCVIIDETHNASSKTFQDFLKQFGVPLKFGFSASPCRSGKYLDYAKIRQFMGSPIIDVSATEMIENNVMAKPHIKMIDNFCDEAFDYPTSYDLGVVHNISRNNIVRNICDKYKKGVLVLVNIVDHGKILEEQIEDSVFISGETPVEERQKIISKFDNGEIPVLIASTILQEGISITHMDCMVLACGGKSNVAIIQKIGRSLRFKKGEKTEVDYYDFLDVGNKYLFKHSKQRIAIYKKCGYNDIKMITSDLEEKK